MSRKTRNDLLLIIICLAAAALFLLFRGGSFLHKKDAVIVVTVDDREQFRARASELVLPYTLTVSGYEGGHNHFIIDEDENGAIGVRCEKADCPDKICVQTGRVTLPDQPVVCLPHRVTARILPE